MPIPRSLALLSGALIVFTCLSADAAVTQQVKNDKPAKKKKATPLTEIIREALEADRSRTFHDFQGMSGFHGIGSMGVSGSSRSVIGTMGGSITVNFANSSSSDAISWLNSLPPRVTYPGEDLVSGTLNLDLNSSFGYHSVLATRPIPESFVTLLDFPSVPRTEFPANIGLLILESPGSDRLRRESISGEMRYGNEWPATITPVPEPSVTILGSLGGLVLFRRRRKP